MKFDFESIGIYRTNIQYPQEAPRQGTLSGKKGSIELFTGKNFETALADLEGMERIWIIFVFDRVSSWKPKVRPPLGGTQKRIGVFATRSPHRPNPIGITCAKLEAVKGLILEVSESDILDGTPILDIKPYIPMADAFPEAKTGWRENLSNTALPVTFNAISRQKAGFIQENGGPDILEFCNVQLGTRDIDPKRLRLSPPDENGLQTLAFRTWRIIFEHAPGGVNILDVRSGYSLQELAPDSEDKYQDKELHRRFKAVFAPEKLS